MSVLQPLFHKAFANNYKPVRDSLLSGSPVTLTARSDPVVAQQEQTLCPSGYSVNHREKTENISFRKYDPVSNIWGAENHSPEYTSVHKYIKIQEYKKLFLFYYF